VEGLKPTVALEPRYAAQVALFTAVDTFWKTQVSKVKGWKKFGVATVVVVDELPGEATVEVVVLPDEATVEVVVLPDEATVVVVVVVLDDATVVEVVVLLPFAVVATKIRRKTVEILIF